jgi:hypothetical protein
MKKESTQKINYSGNFDDMGISYSVNAVAENKIFHNPAFEYCIEPSTSAGWKQTYACMGVQL